MKKSHLYNDPIPEYHPLAAQVRPGPAGSMESTPLKPTPRPPAATPATLQSVLGRHAGERALSDSRKRDLRSAILSFAKLKGQPPAAIPLDLSDIRRTLESMVPAGAQISAKRWSNLR